MEQQTYSSLGRRLGAFLIDCFIIGFLGTIGGFIVPVLGSLIIWFFYAPVLESSEIRATIGKHLMGIQVNDLMGRRLSFRAALLRNILKVVSTVFLFIGFFFSLFSARKQSLHDMFADSVVVYGRSDMPVIDAWLEQSREILRMNSEGLSSFRFTHTSQSLAAQLERLQALFEKGSLTQEEFELAKKKILAD